MIKMLWTLWCYFLRVASPVVCFLTNAVLSVVYWRKRKFLPPVQDPLLLKSATALAKEIREMQIKSEDVVLAYIKRISVIEPFINATIDRCFQDALVKAREADKLVASGRYSKEQLAEEKPFFGVPFSVKIILKVKGLKCTGGSLLFKDEVATEDSPCVALMKRAGAIVIATTNVPELGMDIDTKNKLHGETSNPYDTRRTSGGSSGGESALISAAGSVMGLGNDLGGSIRIPSHFTGLFGHKPSAGVVPNGGCCPDLTFLGDYIYTGPMCRYAEDLVSSMKILTSECNPPLNIGKSVDFSKLKIIYMVQIDGVLVSKVDKDIENGLKNVVSYFQTNYGCETKQVELDLMSRACAGVLHYLNAKTNQKDLKNVITEGRGADIDQRLDFIKFFFGKSEFSFPCIASFNLIKSPLMFNENDIPYYQDLLERLSNKFDVMLDDNTVFLLPTFPKTAPYQYGTFPLLPSSCYTSIFNCLGLPATNCPIGLDKQGLPYGIQVIGRKKNDALTIACAVEIEKVFGGWVAPRSK